MKVRMTQTTKGSPDGIQVNEYEAGKKYDLPESLASVFLGQGFAEEDKALDRAPEIKKAKRRKSK